MTTASRFNLRRFHILFFCGSSQIIPAAKVIFQSKVPGCYSLKGVRQKSYLRLAYNQRRPTPAYSIHKALHAYRLSADSCAMFVFIVNVKTIVSC